MRRLAWVILAVGVAAAVVTPLALSLLAAQAHHAAQQLDTINLAFSPFDQARRLEFLLHEAALLAWRAWAIGIGAAVTAFGILLLAIRRPEKETRL